MMKQNDAGEDVLVDAREKYDSGWYGVDEDNAQVM